MTRTLTARYASTCRGCGEAIRPGDTIAWAGKGRSYHQHCAPSDDAAADVRVWQGRREGAEYSRNRKVYGEALANAWEMEAELARWNRGDDY